MPATGGTEQLVVSDAEGAAWSPTGEGFAFSRFDPIGGWGIWMVAADGSSERRLGSWAGYPQFAWAPDGSVLAFVRSVGDNFDTTEFDLVDAAGNSRLLASYAGFIGPTEITWLPDGSGLVYYEQASGGSTVSVSVLWVPSTMVDRFEQPDGVPDRIIVSPDGSTLAWMIQGASKLRIQPTAGGDARTYETTRGPIAWQPLLIPYAP
jgi:Tol biopolymer transport system component